VRGEPGKSLGQCACSDESFLAILEVCDDFVGPQKSIYISAELKQSDWKLN
jgi:hypothetical protein